MKPVSSKSLFALTTLLVLASACSKGGSGSSTSSAGATAQAAAGVGPCANPISMELAPGETKFELDQVVDGTPGSYVLVGTKVFTHTVTKDGVNQLSGSGDASGAVDTSRKNETTELTKVVCHTSKPGVNDVGSKRTEHDDGNGYTVDSWKNTATNSLNANLDVPAAISTLDGRVETYRTDTFHVKDAVVDTKTTFYPRREQIKHENEPVPPGLTVLTARDAKGDVTMKLKMVKTEDGSTVTLFLAATYRRK